MPEVESWTRKSGAGASMVTTPRMRTGYPLDASSALSRRTWSAWVNRGSLGLADWPAAHPYNARRAAASQRKLRTLCLLPQGRFGLTRVAAGNVNMDGCSPARGGGTRVGYPK